MKTRQEMVYDFMVALAANPEMTPAVLVPEAIAEAILAQANALADKVLETL
jgi:hypothetical protein